MWWSYLIVVFLIALLLSMSYWLFQDSKNQITLSKQNEKLIDNKIQQSKTLEDFENLKQEIKNLHDNTDTLYKDIRNMYRDKYYIVVGIIYILKQNETER